MAIGGRNGYTGIPPGNAFFEKNSAKFGSWDFSLLDQLGIVLRLAGLFPEQGKGSFKRRLP